MTSLSNFILEKLDTLVVVVNFQGKIEYVNPSVKRVLGYEPQQLIGNSWKLTSDHSVGEVYNLKSNTINLLRQRKNVGQDLSFSTERRLKDTLGRDIWVLWNLSLGPGNSLVGIGQDITERKQSENELRRSHTLMTEKNKEVMDSIRYSQRIQQAILPTPGKLKSCFADAFVLYKPKDIVSGDFYWIFENNGLTFLAAIDCTGHGVPGALMTVLANSLLKTIVRQGTEDPGLILQLLDQGLEEEFNNQGSEHTADGMDIALCVFDFSKNEVSYAGAFRPLVRVRKKGVPDAAPAVGIGRQEYTEFRAARYPIGFYNDITKIFETTVIPFESGDRFYLFSDGYIDQFGGENAGTGGKKFNKKAFRNLLLEVQDLRMDEQEGYLEYAFNNWKQQLEQLDDLLVMGVEI